MRNRAMNLVFLLCFLLLDCFSLLDRFSLLPLNLNRFVLATTGLSGSGRVDRPFVPSVYPKRSVVCAATRRAPSPEVVVDITLKYVDINPAASSTLLMVHGWPSLWSTWAKQIQEFEKGYHLVIPDLRGFAASEHPGDTESSGTMGDIVGDLVCILEDRGVRTAVCMGHDWGAQVCYEAARMRPDIFSAVVGLTVPYIPAAGPFVPIQNFTQVFPRLAYQIYFDSQMEAAVAELDADIRRSIRATLRTVESPPPAGFLESDQSFLAVYKDVEEIPPVPFFTSEEEDYFVEEFSTQGFRHTLQFYTTQNKYLSWAFDHDQGNFSIPQPVLAVFPENDPVADWLKASKLLHSSEFIPRLTTKLVPGGHWVHLETHQEVNIIIKSWLQEILDRGTGLHHAYMDEL